MLEKVMVASMGVSSKAGNQTEYISKLRLHRLPKIYRNIEIQFVEYPIINNLLYIRKRVFMLRLKVKVVFDRV